MIPSADEDFVDLGIFDGWDRSLMAEIWYSVFVLSVSFSCELEEMELWYDYGKEMNNRFDGFSWFDLRLLVQYDAWWWMLGFLVHDILTVQFQARFDVCKTLAHSCMDALHIVSMILSIHFPDQVQSQTNKNFKTSCSNNNMEQECIYLMVYNTSESNLVT